MYDCYLTVRSVTWGQKGRDALDRAGLRCRLLRAPREIAPGGCAYALSLPQRDGIRAEAVLDRAGVPVAGSWIRRSDGSFARLER